MEKFKFKIDIKFNNMNKSFIWQGKKLTIVILMRQFDIKTKRSQEHDKSK